CGSEIPLTGGEFKLLSAFLKNPGRVLSRQQLMDVTHGTGWHAYERTVDAQISSCGRSSRPIRKKPKLLKSVHGDGYVFTASVSRQGATEKLTIGFPIHSAGQRAPAPSRIFVISL
ncbi:MAG: winged helix-turn-helix domain-containing protein, partial [Pseudolabrys sp.]